LTVERSRLRIARVEVDVTHWGTPSATGIVLLHGFLTSSHAWRRIGPALASRGHYVVALDFPGSGDSVAPAGIEWTASLAAEMVATALARLGLTRVTLVGTQMGGSIAAWVSTLLPARLERMVLMAAGALGETTRNMTLFRALAQPWLGPWLCRWFPESLFRKKWVAAHGPGHEVDESALAHYLACFRRSGSAQANFALGVRSSYGEDFDQLEPLLQDVKIPTLLVWGEQDQVVPVATGQRFARAITGAELVVIPGCGDFPQEEAPDEVSRLVDEFCTRSRPQERSPLMGETERESRTVATAWRAVAGGRA